MSSPGVPQEDITYVLYLFSFIHCLVSHVHTVLLGWGHLPDKLFAPKSLSQGLLLGSPAIVQHVAGSLLGWAPGGPGNWGMLSPQPLGCSISVSGSFSTWLPHLHSQGVGRSQDLPLAIWVIQ